MRKLSQTRKQQIRKKRQDAMQRNRSYSLMRNKGLMLAGAILLEAGLSYLGAGVQNHNASWGTMIAAGVPLLTSTPSLLLAPSVMLVLTTASINVIGESLRGSSDSGRTGAELR